MSTTRSTRSLAVVVAACAAMSACGLKAEPTPAGAPQVAASDTPAAAQQPASSAPPATASPTGAPGAATTSAPAPQTPAMVPPTQPAGSTAASPSQAAPGSTVGVDTRAKTLRVVLHGSAAGAAGARKYWDASGPGGGPRRVLGLRVVVDHLDDEHGTRDPGRQCETAARTGFLLVSVADVEPARSCAQSRLLRRDGVPYISLGGADRGLGGPHHFASSLTHRQQAPLILRMARDNGFLAKKWAVVVAEDAGLEDARASIVAALEGVRAAGRAGAFDEARDVYAVEPNPNNCVTLGNRLREGGYGSVYFVGASPLFYGQCVNQHPSAVYTGVGPWPENERMADPTCSGGSQQYRGFYLNATPDARKARSLAKGAPELAEEEIPGWAAMQMLEQALSLVKGPLGRASFIRALAGGGTAGGVLNPTAYRGRTQLGGTAAYANRITCSGGRAVVATVGTYRR